MNNYQALINELREENLLLKLEVDAAYSMLDEIFKVKSMNDLENMKADVELFKLLSGERMGWPEGFEDEAA